MIGNTINQYEILEKLGEGGMGVVYKALDTKLQRSVALKFLSKKLTENQSIVQRFINEAQTASALDHASVCTIYEINETDDGQMFIAMAYYDGETLKQRIDRNPLSFEDTLDITSQVAQGLLRAHEAGIMHRDIKPENIIITNYGEAKILDFGLAKLATVGRETEAGTILGTFVYMSPEQIQGKELDHRTDIWSLGVMIYEMLTGELPFDGSYTQAVMYAIMHEPPNELEEREEIPPDFRNIIGKLLQKEADKRYQSVSKFLDDLKALSDTGSTISVQETPESANTKKSFLEEYKNDIMVSYAHLDDKALTDGQKGWIENFHQALEVRLEQLLGSDTRISREAREKRKTRSEKPDGTRFDASALMVSVVSPQYIKSDYCMTEVSEFCDSAEKDKGLWIHEKARVFKAVKTFVSRDSQPEILQQFSDYDFFRFDPVSGRPQEFWPELGSEASRNFWMKLEDIAYDIYLIMEDIKAATSEDRQSSSTSKRQSVYLSETTYELLDFRDKIKRQLQQRGFTILPERPLPLNASELRAHVDECLQRASVSIHLLGENYGVVPEGETRSIPELQYELSLQRNKNNAFTPFVWIPKDIKIEDARQERLIDSLTRSSENETTEVLQTSLDEFKTYLIDKLSRDQTGQITETESGPIQRIYLQCDHSDLDATAKLEEYLFDQGFEIKLPAFEGDEFELFEAHKENLLLCDATIIFYGNASDAWLNAKLADLHKIAGYGRSEEIKGKLVYISAPETKQKLRFRTREAMVVKSFKQFEPEALQEFIDTIKSQGSR